MTRELQPYFGIGFLGAAAGRSFLSFAFGGHVLWLPAFLVAWTWMWWLLLGLRNRPCTDISE